MLGMVFSVASGIQSFEASGYYRQESEKLSRQNWVVREFQRKCPTNFSLSQHHDKLKLIGHQTDPVLKIEEATKKPGLPGIVATDHRLFLTRERAPSADGLVSSSRSASNGNGFTAPPES